MPGQRFPILSQNLRHLPVIMRKASRFRHLAVSRYLAGWNGRDNTPNRQFVIVLSAHTPNLTECQ